MATTNIDESVSTEPYLPEIPTTSLQRFRKMVRNMKPSVRRERAYRAADKEWRREWLAGRPHKVFLYTRDHSRPKEIGSSETREDAVEDALQRAPDAYVHAVAQLRLEPSRLSCPIADTGQTVGVRPSPTSDSPEVLAQIFVRAVQGLLEEHAEHIPR